MLNIDLHSHSNVSDGLLPPAEVARRAKANGVDVWALTDHDEVGGVREAREAANDIGLNYVPGIEISVTWAGSTVHIVGLHIDENNEELRTGLARTRAGRARRAGEIAQQLAHAGIPGALEGALRFVANPDLISRTHFARFLIDQGICGTVNEVFQRFLVQGKPGYVPHRWAVLSDAVHWIRAAGGMAVIAHPGRYKFSDLAFDEFFSAFKAAGGCGVEVITGSHTEYQYTEFAEVARRRGLLASRGSDFHGPGESRVDLGALPPLPEDLQPVWRDWGM